MVRTQRLEAPGAIHHVVPKGTGGRRIVEDDQDRRAFLGRFAAVARDCSWISHSDCLMSTHHHAVIETRQANLGVGLKRLLVVMRARSIAAMGSTEACSPSTAGRAVSSMTGTCFAPASTSSSIRSRPDSARTLATGHGARTPRPLRARISSRPAMNVAVQVSD